MKRKQKRLMKKKNWLKILLRFNLTYYLFRMNNHWCVSFNHAKKMINHLVMTHFQVEWVSQNKILKRNNIKKKWIQNQTLLKTMTNSIHSNLSWLLKWRSLITYFKPQEEVGSLNRRNLRIHTQYHQNRYLHHLKCWKILFM